MVRVKICGITSVRDAKHALDSGADAIGLVFAKSPRRVSIQTAREITRAVGPWIATVGVFVNENAATMRHVARTCGLSTIQLHGDERPATLKALTGFKTIKAFRVGDDFSTAEAEPYRAADAFLFDSKLEGMFGGTGKSFDWNILRSRKLPRPVVISGGLKPENVAWVVHCLRPYGVDVSSGVEKAPGKKDPKRVKEFIRNAKKV